VARGITVRPTALLVHGLAFLLFGLLVAEVVVRVPFPCDLFFWAESPFMTDMLKITNGLPIYTDPTDANSFVYPPGLLYLTHAVLGPLGLALDIRACRVVNILIGVAAALTSASIVTSLASELRAGLSRRAFFALAFASATLLIFSNPSATVPHPDSLHALHASATLLLTYTALHRRSLAFALAAMAVAGLGVFTKQPAALSVIGVGAALLVGHRWGRQPAALLLATGLSVTGVAMASLLVPPNARFFLFSLPAAQGIQWWKIIGLVDMFFRGNRIVLLVLAPACVLYLHRRGGEAGRHFVLAWSLVGVFEVLPNVSAVLKTMGASNNLTIMGLWLFLPVWAVLGYGGAEDRASGLAGARLVGVAAILLSLFPAQLPPSASQQLYCRRLIDTIGADLRAGKRVLLGHGTTPLIWNGSTDVPRFRSNTILELSVGGKTQLLAAIQDKVERARYDRVYGLSGDASTGILARRYSEVGTMQHAEPQPFPLVLPMGWGWLEYVWMRDVVIREPSERSGAP